MNEKNKIEIFVVMHKIVDLNKMNLDKMYKRLLVGKKSSAEENIILDSTGENISEKNKFYCELTGLYWIWKNVECEYVGLCHYRRFFTKNELSVNKKYFYTYEELKKKLNGVECLVADKLYVKDNTIYDHYARYHFKKDLDVLKNLIKKEFPDYCEAFDEAFSKNYFYPCNMMFCKKKIFDEYAKWLFSLIERYEEVVDISGYSVDQARIFGFLTERLLNVWIIKNEINIKELPVVQTDSTLKFRIHMLLNKILKCSVKEGNKYFK